VRSPVNKSIPYVLQPEQIIPGVADYYATSVFDGFDFANLWLKGRPIKIDNNTIAELNLLQMQEFMLILSLYDNMRLKEPKLGKKFNLVCC
jgi:molybdopterin-containing oxidoreductase family iron-sulfur binding subunit